MKTLEELKTEIAKYQYLEDTRFIDVALANVIATRLKIRDPLWVIFIGASSSGKTQLLRPLAMTGPDFIHSIDDLTENTFLSGFNQGKGKNTPVSLLNRIGSLGMLIISDLTGIFSKGSESKSSIIAQFRMIYDGEVTKHVGTMSKPLHWKGWIGILGGATPAIYKHFEQSASFGERFLYYRLHDYDRIKAATRMMNRVNKTEVDKRLAELYGEYIKGVCEHHVAVEDLDEETVKVIINVSSCAELLRVAGQFDWKTEFLVDIPVPSMPMRTCGQLATLACGLLNMKIAEEGKDAKLGPYEHETIEWCGYSLADDERRAILKVFAGAPYDQFLSTSVIGDITGLPTAMVRKTLMIWSSIKIVSRGGDERGLTWRLNDKRIWELARRMNHITTEEKVVDRGVSSEEKDEISRAADEAFNQSFGGGENGMS